MTSNGQAAEADPLIAIAGGGASTCSTRREMHGLRII